MPSNNPLPPKENALFKRILKCYELKQYKNGLKFAKQILNNVKFAEHGETLAMKGLTLNCLGRKEEAYDYVRRGLRNDLTSHVCWHVFGLLQRADKKYDEAIKAYRNALKWDKDNVQILRDLSLLQIQMRDLEGYRDTRYQLLRLRPGQRASWIGFATAYHLISDYSNALQVLEEFRKTLVKTGYDYEQSELLLYEAMVLGEAGDSAKALEHLDLYQNDICDKTTLLESKGQLLLQCKLGGQAEAIFRQLLDRNAENKSYYQGLEQALALQKGELSVTDKLSLYDELHQQYSRALLPTRIPLTYAAGDEFRQRVNAYLRRALAKGVPPLFVEMRSLYSDPQKVEIVQELMLNYVTSLQSTDKFSAEDAEAAPASALLWSYYFLCQHYDYLEDTSLALRYIDLALEHTPTLIELHVAKGRINKHAGNPLLAWQCLQEAAALDTADRYLNSKAAKYALRANLLQEAEEAASKFTREGVSAMENLNEMQCMWFQTECAAAYQRLGQYGDALKKCHEVDRHFSEILEDQFDFHTYCLRKITLRSYVRLLRLEDSLRGHPFYFKAAQVAINVYLTLHDHPPEFQDGTKEQEQAALTTTELKKLRAKQRKAQRKAEEEAAAERQQAERRELYAKNRQHHQEKTQAGEPEPPPPDELQPAKLIQTKDPLGEALKFLIPLQDFASDRVETHLLTFEIQHRRGKPLLMLQAVQRAVRVLGEKEARAHPQMHTCLVRLAIRLDKESKGQSPDAPLIPVLQRSSQQLFQGLTPYELNEQFLEKHANSIPHLLQGTRMLLLLDSKSEERAVKLVTRLENVTGRTQYHCSNVLYALQQGELGQVGIDAASEYQERCYALFPHATAFAPAGHKEDDASSPVTSNHLEE